MGSLYFPNALYISLICVPHLSLQMVVVSDDVHEYAVALKDTEEKIARCPARVNAHHSLLYICDRAIISLFSIIEEKMARCPTRRIQIILPIIINVSN